MCMFGCVTPRHREILQRIVFPTDLPAGKNYRSNHKHLRVRLGTNIFVVLVYSSVSD